MTQQRDHALVVGGSIAGLLAARVLADVYQQVTVVERDALPSERRERKGVPQAGHAHGLLQRGVQAVDELFPGLLEEFIADGVPVVRRYDQVWFSFNDSVLYRQAEEGDPAFMMSRPYLEAAIRDRVQALPNVRIRDSCTLGHLAFSGGTVTGAEVILADGGSQHLASDLVVDATGRGGRTPIWLKQHGFVPPPEDRVDVDVMYASKRIRLPAGALDDLHSVIIAAVPDRPTTLNLSAQEHGTHILTVAGYAGHHPSSDSKEFLKFTQELAPAHVFDAIREAESLEDVHRFRFPTSRRRRYERLRRFPVGLLVLGDGLSNFNPLFGQGMTVAALQALALRATLTEERPDLARRYFARAAKPIDQAWQLTTGADSTVLGIRQSPPQRLVTRYLNRLLAAAAHDPVLTTRFLRVSGLMDPPSALFKPSVLRRVLHAD